MIDDPYRSTAAHEARLRRLVHKEGCALSRSRWRLGSIDNFGGFMIVDQFTNCVVAGSRWDLTPGHVEEWWPSDAVGWRGRSAEIPRFPNR